jgi:rubrerythrin
MEATTVGMNRTGAAVSPIGTKAMTEAANELSPPQPIDTGAMEAERLIYINEADALGSIPPPASVKGVLKTGVAALKGGHPTILMDKLGERIAFERGGTRLYDALITKYQGAEAAGGESLPAAAEVVVIGGTDDMRFEIDAQESPGATLERIRAEELSHFRMLCDAMVQLGGDPTAQTPCADSVATASMGLIQVLTDPRTTLAQCLNAILTAELTDNAGWELLITLTEDAGEAELAGRFLGALAQEEEHLAIVRGWLTSLLSTAAGTPAV